MHLTARGATTHGFGIGMMDQVRQQPLRWVLSHGSPRHTETQVLLPTRHGLGPAVELPTSEASAFGTGKPPSTQRKLDSMSSDRKEGEAQIASVTWAGGRRPPRKDVSMRQRHHQRTVQTGSCGPGAPSATTEGTQATGPLRWESLEWMESEIGPSGLVTMTSPNSEKDFGS